MPPGTLQFEVLIADDDPDVRDLLAEFFREHQLPVSVAHDGRAAITALERSAGRYGLVLADINMPGADGFAVLTAARRVRPDAYVVIMTGYASLDTAITAVRLGALDYLTKPFSLGQIEVLLDRARALVEREPESGRRNSAAEAGLSARLNDIDGRLDRVERLLGEIHTLITSNPSRR